MSTPWARLVSAAPALYPVHEQGAEVPLEGPGVVKPAELLVQAGGEGVAVQVDKGVGIHGEAPFKVRINNKKL